MQLNSFVNQDRQVLVSVAMPIYNAGEYLVDAVNSIIAQTYTHWELIIIDDGSIDNAINNIEKMQDKRIRIYKDGLNKGLAARLNEAITLAKGEYLARMDQDDIAMPERFDSQVKSLNSNPNVDLLASRVLKINSKNQLVGESPNDLTHQQLCSKPWLGFNMPHPTWMGRVSWFKQYWYKVPQSYYSEDYELLLRSYQNSHFECLAECYLKYRIKDTLVWANQLKARKAVLKLQMRHFLRHSQYSSLLLSLLMFVSKCSKDIFSILLQNAKQLGIRH